MRFYLLFRWSAAWVGFHYGAYYRRLCVNVIPFVTFCFVLKGGESPHGK